MRIPALCFTLLSVVLAAPLLNNTATQNSKGEEFATRDQISVVTSNSIRAVNTRPTARCLSTRQVYNGEEGTGLSLKYRALCLETTTALLATLSARDVTRVLVKRVSNLHYTEKLKDLLPNWREKGSSDAKMLHGYRSSLARAVGDDKKQQVVENLRARLLTGKTLNLVKKQLMIILFI